MKHYELDMERINRKFREVGSGKYLKLPEGKTKLRILPWKDGVFYEGAVLHYGFKDGQKGFAIPCLEGMHGKPCPVCKVWARMEESGDKAVKKIARDIAPKDFYMSNVVDRTDGRIKIWSYSGAKLKQIISLLKDEDYGPGILNPDTGNDISISREGTGFNTKYSEPRVSPKSTPVGIKNWEKKIHNLTAEMNFRSTKQIINDLEDNYGNYMEDLGIKFKLKKKKSE